MPVITPVIPDKTDAVDRLSAAEVMGLRDAVLASLSAAGIAAITGNNAILYTNDEGVVVGSPVLPGNLLTAADILTGTEDEGALYFNVAGFVSVGAATVCPVTTNAVTLNFSPTGGTLRCTTEMTDNVTTLSLAAGSLPAFAMGLWQIKGHATNPYTITLPTGGTWASANGATSIYVPAASYILASLCTFDSKTLIGWSTPYTVIA